MSDTAAPSGRITITVKKEWCKSCKICAELCPRDVLVMRDGYPVPENLDACNACNLCELRCPDLAIYVTVARAKREEAS